MSTFPKMTRTGNRISVSATPHNKSRISGTYGIEIGHSAFQYPREQQQFGVVHPPQSRLDFRQPRPAQIPTRDLELRGKRLLRQTHSHPQLADGGSDQILTAVGLLHFWSLTLPAPIHEIAPYSEQFPNIDMIGDSFDSHLKMYLTPLL